jgi:hypothetical protein
MRAEILFEDAAEIALRRAGRGPVIVRQVEMRDAKIEGANQDFARGFIRSMSSEWRGEIVM